MLDLERTKKILAEDAAVLLLHGLVRVHREACGCGGCGGGWVLVCWGWIRRGWGWIRCRALDPPRSRLDLLLLLDPALWACAAATEDLGAWAGGSGGGQLRRRLTRGRGGEPQRRQLSRPSIWPERRRRRSAASTVDRAGVAVWEQPHGWFQ
ncbi:hypothetical protein BS78_K144200 [Paspalum vaginatum]|uniref:Uncharacterized protein n=1 Tax=Paspalum vaginatum TaxID=158149 RepID=A0A9W7XEM9_9POAL|nr:hypothetical protein BS78_K144200 [Paspalum vaginatum]